MMQRITIESYFKKSYENIISQRMLHYSYMFPKEEMVEYVSQVNDISIEKIIEYIISEHPVNGELEAKDIIQFSSFENATIQLCVKMNDFNDPGMKYKEIGKMLLNDGVDRKDSAYVKYGENHVKTATILGLTYELAGSYFLSSVGKMYIDLEEQVQKQLLCRLILRTKMISKIIQTEDREIDFRQLAKCLSDKTYVRRRSNTKRIVGYLRLLENKRCNSIMDRLVL